VQNAKYVYVCSENEMCVYVYSVNENEMCVYVCSVNENEMCEVQINIVYMELLLQLLHYDLARGDLL